MLQFAFIGVDCVAILLLDKRNCIFSYEVLYPKLHRLCIIRVLLRSMRGLVTQDLWHIAHINGLPLLEVY